MSPSDPIPHFHSRDAGHTAVTAKEEQACAFLPEVGRRSVTGTRPSPEYKWLGRDTWPGRGVTLIRRRPVPHLLPGAFLHETEGCLCTYIPLFCRSS